MSHQGSSSRARAGATALPPSVPHGQIPTAEPHGGGFRTRLRGVMARAQYNGTHDSTRLQITRPDPVGASTRALSELALDGDDDIDEPVILQDFGSGGGAQPGVNNITSLISNSPVREDRHRRDVPAEVNFKYTMAFLQVSLQLYFTPWTLPILDSKRYLDLSSWTISGRSWRR